MRRTRMTFAGTLLTTGVLLSLAGPAVATENCRCSDFATQAEAQERYDESPNRHRQLDKDRDGVACERLPDAPAPAPAPVEQPAPAPAVAPESVEQPAEAPPVVEQPAPQVGDRQVARIPNRVEAGDGSAAAVS